MFIINSIIFKKTAFMKQTEIDVTGLSLKEYRNKFGKDVSVGVLRRAYAYSKNGHLPQNAIATASVIYAEPFKQRDLAEHGFMAEKALNTVTIWNVLTETATAQRALLEGEWDFHNRHRCIARLGENYECTLRTTLEFTSDSVFGVYEHRHRFVAVVSLEQNPESVLSVAKLKQMAYNLAKNALAHYPEYLAKKQNRERNISRGKKNVAELPEFRKFLLEQPLRFVDGINDENSIFYNPKGAVTINAYISQQSEQLHQKLSIASVDVFGNF